MAGEKRSGEQFVDEHRVQLIDRVTDVGPVLDGLLDKEVVPQGIYADIMAKMTSEAQMRQLYSGALHAAGREGKEVFYQLLEKHEPYLMKDLKRNKNAKKESDLEAAVLRVRDLEARLNSKDTAMGEKRTLEAEMKDLKAQLAELEGSLADAKRKVQDEMLRRVDTENRLQTLKEELEFQKNIANQLRLHGDDSEASSEAGGPGAPCHIVQEASASGRVTVEEECDGESMRLRNKSHEDQPIGSWQLKRQVGDGSPIVFKFPHKFSVKAGGTVTIWAASGGGTHNPPTDLVWRNQSSWGAGDVVRTTLTSASGEEMAKRKVTRTLNVELIAALN
ncbi:prelamin-A/C-like [Pseudoliparis swirei]|uniref:prelamin-A/C-like n=1 Tax=Pseudoliparis swirei TaxID=2059687 RepID=UPI0024BF06FE|nr:prelamin-A/C-like [Pseudoliparis swirei]XP_056261926.1 prelamin-A/C-like [Pseudoliparis swirei]